MPPMRPTRREWLSRATAFAACALWPRTAHAADPVPADRLPYGGSWDGLVGIAGGIPVRTAQSGQTIVPYTGSAGAIQTAINKCGANQFVQLGAGTFNLSDRIFLSKSHVTLRGAVDGSGAPATVINFTGDAALIIGDLSWDTGSVGLYTTINVTSGATRGSTTITLASNPGSLKVGQLAWITAPSSAQIGGEGNWSCWFGSHPWSQCVKVVSKIGRDVTFTPPISADYLSGAIRINFRDASLTTELAGAENLSFQRDGGASANYTHYLRMAGADSCWFKNVKTYWSGGGGVHHCVMQQTFRAEIRHCEMHHTAAGGSSSNAYAILGIHSSNFLIEDNYFHDVPNVMPLMGMNGGAFAFNYINDLPYPVSPPWLSQIVFPHGSHCHYNLFEGNWCASHFIDGGSGCHSRNNIFFRERMRGWDGAPPPKGKTANTQCVTTENRHDNLVIAGCVLGESGYHTQYEGAYQGNNAIFALDSTSNRTALRIGNYNTANRAIPAVESLGAGQFLKSSYLHASKPSWFGSLPWPWCDPANFTQSNTPQNLPAGYRAANGADPAPGPSGAPAAAPPPPKPQVK